MGDVVPALFRVAGVGGVQGTLLRDAPDGGVDGRNCGDGGAYDCVCRTADRREALKLCPDGRSLCVGRALHAFLLLRWALPSSAAEPSVENRILRRETKRREGLWVMLLDVDGHLFADEAA